jgi:hypothetical protein
VLAEPRYESGGIPNYYSLVLLTSGDPAPAAAAFTAAGLPPDSVQWGYRPLHQRPLLAEYARHASMPTTSPAALSTCRSTPA